MIWQKYGLITWVFRRNSAGKNIRTDEKFETEYVAIPTQKVHIFSCDTVLAVHPTELEHLTID